VPLTQGRADIALRTVLIPCYVPTVPDNSYYNVDVTTSWTAVKCEDLISVVLSTLAENFIACYCTCRTVCLRDSSYFIA